MKLSETDLLRIIDKLYSAALERDGSEGWTAALAEVSKAIGGFGTALVPFAKPSCSIVSPSLAEINSQYSNWWWQHDIRMSTAREKRLQGIVTDDKLLPSLDRSRNPFYQDFLRPFGIGSYAAYIFTPISGQVISLHVDRALSLGAFENEDLDLLAILGPHAARALAASAQLTAASSRDIDMLALIDRLNCGAMIIRRDGDVSGMNKSAEKLLNDGLSIRRRRLSAASVAHQRIIDRLLDAAFNHPIENIGSTVLPRPSGRRPLVLQAVPLTQTPPIQSILFGLETILLLVIDPEAESQPAQIAALRGLGLTRAEAAVALLVGTGLKPKDASEQLKTTTATVRVHLKSIFQKLDLQGQGQLVKFVSRLVIVKD